MYIKYVVMHAPLFLYTETEQPDEEKGRGALWVERGCDDLH